MALVGAVVLPHPPLLIPDVAAGAAGELDDLRAACLEALTGVFSRRRGETQVLIVGGGTARSTFDAGSVGTLRGFGVPVDVPLGGELLTGSTTDASARLPLSLTVGAWLFGQLESGVADTLPVRAESVPFAIDSDSAMAMGRELGASAHDVVMVCMGDGSSSLSVKAPGYLVAGAGEWQEAVTGAIGKADIDALAALTPHDAERFGAAGRAAWQVLAGAAEGATWESALLAEDNQYGVAYIVAQWTRIGDAP